MSSETLVVPTYKREELLFLCLEAIRGAGYDRDIIVSSDKGHVSQELVQTAVRFDVTLVIREGGTGFGNSDNLLALLRSGASSGAEIVHLVEDDTILQPGYFKWARRELKTGRYAVVCGHIGNSLNTWYTSPCASWRAEPLRKCLEIVPAGYAEAANREEMQKILDAPPEFQRSAFRYGSAEQDGFFLRAIEHFGWKTLFPPKPLCVHLGEWGYNRPMQEGPKGSFEDRVKYCRALLANRERRSQLFGKRIVDLECEGENA